MKSRLYPLVVSGFNTEISNNQTKCWGENSCNCFEVIFCNNLQIFCQFCSDSLASSEFELGSVSQLAAGESLSSPDWEWSDEPPVTAGPVCLALARLDWAYSHENLLYTLIIWGTHHPIVCSDHITPPVIINICSPHPHLHCTLGKFEGWSGQNFYCFDNVMWTRERLSE